MNTISETSKNTQINNHRNVNDDGFTSTSANHEEGVDTSQFKENPSASEAQQRAIDMRNSPDFGRNDALTVYICFAASFLVGITWFVALIYAYVRRDDIRNTIYYSHLNYIIRTCWWGLLWATIGIIGLFVFGLGIFVLIANGIWSIYRLIKGFIAFNDYKELSK